MANSASSENEEKNTGGRPADTFNVNSGQSGDLKDSPRDEERMQPEEVILDLPEVKDIPGQEHINPPQLGELGDTTISSDDEEGVGILDFEGDADEDEGEEDPIAGTDADVTDEEKTLLDQADQDMPTEDNADLRDAALDNTDMEGDPLNEEGDVTGADLDTSGVDSDDPMEDIGEEDEENNTYSLGGDDKDNITEGTP